MKALPRSLSLLASGLCSVSLAAQSLQVVKDINTHPANPVVWSLPSRGVQYSAFREDQKFVRLGGSVLFSATTMKEGRELFAFNGKQAVLVRDIAPGSVSSSPSEFHVAGTKLYFAADDQTHGRELWVSDGTKTGTRVFLDLVPGSTGSNPKMPVALASGKVLFFGTTNTGTSLYLSDGTAAGTLALTALSAGSEARYLTCNPQGTRAWFTLRRAVSPYYIYSVWVTDGTKTGTYSVLTLQGARSSDAPLGFRFLGSKTVFTIGTYRSGVELWVSDGSSAGTKLLKDISAGSSRGAYISSSTVVSGKLLFEGSTFALGRELWITDGTSAGTKLVKDVLPGLRTSGYASELISDSAGKTAYFSTHSATTGKYEIWSSDGTTAGTKRFVGPLPGMPRFLQPSAGKLYFSLSEAGSGEEPWVSDGTSSGTKRIVDLEPGPRSSRAWYITDIGSGSLVFYSETTKYGAELGVTGGTPSSTRVVDLSTWTGPPVTESDRVRYVTPFLGKLLFIAEDGHGSGDHGSELWISDGTSAGTKLVKDVNPGPADGAAGPIACVGKLAYFGGNTASNGYELWVTDGTSAGTKLVKDLAPGTASSFPRRLTCIGDKLYFSATIPGKGVEPCVCDGTAAGTFLLKDVHPGALGSRPSGFAGLPGRVLFGTDELWITDGTSAGTKLLKDIEPGYGSSNPFEFCLFEGKVYFSAYQYKSGAELYVSDFTSSGTHMVSDLYPGKTSALPRQIQRASGNLLFQAMSSTQGLCLWTSDGTATGTKVLAKIPSKDGSPMYLTAVGSRRAWFSSDADPARGHEPSYFDFATKSFRDFDFVPGAAGSDVSNSVGNRAAFAIEGDRLYFQATRTPSPGSDMQLCFVENGATAQRFGDVRGPAELWAQDPVLGSTAAMHAWTSVKSAIHVFVFGAPSPFPISLGNGYDSYILPSSFGILGAGIGARPSYALPIPRDASLKGIRVLLQDWVLDPSLFPKGIVLSDGVLWALGI